MDVELVEWPQEAERREALRRAGRPRLLAIEPGAHLPVDTDCFEDWVRLPADDDELDLRISALARRHRAHRSEKLDRPVLDEHGLLYLGDAWVALPPVEARLASALVDRFGAVVGRDLLTRTGWPGGTSDRNSLDVHVLRLRRRIATIGLRVRTVRSRGYLLELAEPNADPSTSERRASASSDVVQEPVPDA